MKKLIPLLLTLWIASTPSLSQVAQMVDFNQSPTDAMMAPPPPNDDNTQTYAPEQPLPNAEGSNASNPMNQ